eukprot:10544030-Lingulodinium_polyedra.AAC.1
MHFRSHLSSSVAHHVSAMSSLASSVAPAADELQSALAAFGKGRRQSKAPGSTAEPDSQKDQKKQAYERNKALLAAPQHVRDKWNAICTLKGRDRAKNSEKTKFTQMLLKDCKFEDVYWQTTVEDTFTRSNREKDHWLLRAKANTQHGGGKEGAES